MPLYAHAHLEDPRSGVVYKPGDAVPEDLPGVDELVDGGAVDDTKPERNVIADSDGNVILEVDSGGVVNRTQHIKRFDGDFTPEEIKDPDTETPLAGVHKNEAEHRAQDPSPYFDGRPGLLASDDQAGGQD